jgi:hypothetical protein
MRRRLTVAGRALALAALVIVVVGLLYASLAANGMAAQGHPQPDPRPGTAAAGR